MEVLGGLKGLTLRSASTGLEARGLGGLIAKEEQERLRAEEETKAKAAEEARIHKEKQERLKVEEEAKAKAVEDTIHERLFSLRDSHRGTSRLRGLGALEPAPAERAAAFFDRKSCKKKANESLDMRWQV